MLLSEPSVAVSFILKIDSKAACKVKFLRARYNLKETTALHSVEELRAGYKDPRVNSARMRVKMTQNLYLHQYIVPVTYSVTVYLYKKERTTNQPCNPPPG